MQELWKEFPLDSRYEVSTEGRLRRTSNQRIRKCSLKQNGYKGLVLTYPGRERIKGYDLHVMIALAWLGPRPLGFDVSHLDGDRLNNRLDNLAYESRKENSRKNFNKFCRAGKRIRLTEEMVKQIKRDRTSSNSELALKLRVKSKSIWKVKKGLTWRYL